MVRFALQDVPFCAQKRHVLKTQTARFTIDGKNKTRMDV